MPITLTPDFNATREALAGVKLTADDDLSPKNGKTPLYRSEHLIQLMRLDGRVINPDGSVINPDGRFEIVTKEGVTRIAIAPMPLSGKQGLCDQENLNRILFNALVQGVRADASEIRIAVPVEVSSNHWVTAAITINLPEYEQMGTFVPWAKAWDVLKKPVREVDDDIVKKAIAELDFEASDRLRVEIINTIVKQPGTDPHRSSAHTDYYKDLAYAFGEFTNYKETVEVNVPFEQRDDDICGGLAFEHTKSFLDTGKPMEAPAGDVKAFQDNLRAQHQGILTAASFTVGKGATATNPLAALKKFWEDAKDDRDLNVTSTTDKLTVEVKEKDKVVSTITYTQADKKTQISHTTTEIAKLAINAYIEAHHPGADRKTLKLVIGDESSFIGREALLSAAKDLGIQVEVKAAPKPPEPDLTIGSTTTPTPPL